MTKLMTVKEVAEMCNVVPGTVHDWAERKKIPHYKVGNLLRFKKEEIERWLGKKCRVEVRPQWPVSHRRRA